MEAPVNRILTQDCVEVMQSLPASLAQLVFADPPYNIGYDYDGEYKDNLPYQQYAAWSETWMRAACRILSPSGAMWIAIGDEWVSELDLIARRSLRLYKRSHVIWYVTFGVNCEKNFSRSHTHLLYFTKHPKDFVFNAEQLRIPSARQLVYNDKRANPKGRLPDNTWIIRPQDLPEGFAAEGDTWHIPRICGTFKQRKFGAANQMPEQLLGRIIRACSNPGDLVVDPFAGTGTTAATAKKLGRNFLSMEQSATVAARARLRVERVKEGDPLDGPIPQGG